MEQVKAIQPDTGSSNPLTETLWRTICRTKRAFTTPLLREQKPRQGATCGYGTEKLRPLLIAKEVIAALALGTVWLVKSWQGASLVAGVP